MFHIASAQITLCEDTDNGIDYYHRGIVTSDGMVFEDFCRGDVLNETYCDTDGSVGFFGFDCMSENKSCGFGRCLGPEDGLCSDSDGGIDFDVRGKAALGGEYDVEAFCRDDVCLGEVLSETYCNAYGNIDMLDHDCTEDNKSCINGRCVGPDDPICIDSDAGLNYTEKGLARSGRKESWDSKWDYCKGNVLVEHFCEGDGSLGKTGHYCMADDMECGDGRCIEAGTEPACFDTDSGRNLNEKGNTGIGNTTKEDYCLGTMLIEFFCNERGNVERAEVACPAFCENGSCTDKPRAYGEESLFLETFELNAGPGNDSIIESNFGMVLIIDTGKKALDQEKVIIKTHRYLPYGLPSTEDMRDNMYQLINISVSDGLKSSVESVKMIIQVPKSWLYRVGAEKEDVFIIYFDKTEYAWRYANVIYEGETNTHVIYTTENSFLFEIVYVGSSPTEEFKIWEIMFWVIVIVIIGAIWAMYFLKFSGSGNENA